IRPYRRGTHWHPTFRRAQPPGPGVCAGKIRRCETPFWDLSSRPNLAKRMECDRLAGAVTVPMALSQGIVDLMRTPRRKAPLRSGMFIVIDNAKAQAPAGRHVRFACRSWRSSILLPARYYKHVAPL